MKQRRLLSIVMSLCLILTLLPTAALADGANDGAAPVTLDISKGSITIDADGYTAEGNSDKVSFAGSYVINSTDSGTTAPPAAGQITINGVAAGQSVTLGNLTAPLLTVNADTTLIIAGTVSLKNCSISAAAPAVKIGDNATLTLSSAADASLAVETDSKPGIAGSDSAPSTGKRGSLKMSNYLGSFSVESSSTGIVNLDTVDLSGKAMSFKTKDTAISADGDVTVGTSGDLPFTSIISSIDNSLVSSATGNIKLSYHADTSKNSKHNTGVPSSASQFSAPEGSVDITANRVELSNTPSSQAKLIATAGKTVRITSTADVLELQGDISAGRTDSPGSITLQSAKEISWSCANITGNLTATAADGYFEMWSVGGGSAATLHGSAVLTAHNSVDMRNVNVTGNVRVPGASSVDITNTVANTTAIGGTADLHATYNVVVSATESEKEIGKETGNSLVSDKGAIIRRNSKSDTATVGGKSYPFQASDLCMEEGTGWPTVPTLFREDAGYALWEPAASGASGGTLTLCCAVLHGGNGSALVLPDGPITIVLAGDTASSLLTTGNASASDVAVHNKGDLTITGSGELHAETIDASGANAASGCAIRLNNGNLKISGNVIVGILSGMKVKSGDDASACGIYANGNVSIEGAAKVNTQLSPTSIRSTGAVSVASTGSGYVFAPTVEAKSFTSTGSGYQSGIVTTEKDVEFFGLSALQQDTTYNKKVIVESGANLTITGGSTLTLADTADTLDNRGTVINNGVIVFPKSYTADQIKALHLQGIGTVKIGADGEELSNAGATRRILADTSIDYTGKAGDGYTTTVSGNTVRLVLDDGVTVTASGASALGNGDTSNYVQLPAGKDVEISAKGTASIQGGIDTNGAASLTCTGGTLNVGGSIADLTAAKITVSGGTVHVFETLTAYNSQTPAESTVSVTGGAKLICELGVAAATRANNTMTGTITVDGKGTELNAAVYTNALKLTNGAKVTAKGQSARWGVQTFGPVSVTGGSTLNASGSTALYMGGKLTVDSTSTLNAAGSICALLISTSHGETAADLLAVANLPAGLQLKHSAPDSVQGGVNWSLFPSNVTEPVSRSDFESSAVKTLTLKPTAVNPGNPDNPGGSTGGSTGSTGTNADSKTTTNTDGSKTTTVTDKATGTVTETTKAADGSTRIVETKKDGTVTEKIADKAGNKLESLKKPDGSMTATMAKTDGSKVESQTTTDGKTTATITVPAGVDKTTVVIPTPEKPKAGMVAVIKKADGTRQIVKNSLPTENGVAVTLTDGATVELVDNSKSFKDVPASSWAKSAVDFVSARDIMNGTAPGTFNAQKAMNRAEIWSVLYRQNVGNAADSTTGKWYENAQKWAQEQNLSDGTNPTGEISRQQMVTILWRAAGSPKADGTLTGYADAASAADYAKEALTWAVKVGIISGTDADTLNPGGDASRLQVAAILMRYLQMNVQ